MNKQNRQVFLQILVGTTPALLPPAYTAIVKQVFLFIISLTKENQ